LREAGAEAVRSAEIEQRILNEMDTSFIELTGSRDTEPKEGGGGDLEGKEPVRKRKRITLLL